MKQRPKTGRERHRRQPLNRSLPGAHRCSCQGDTVDAGCGVRERLTSMPCGR
jgi:hypothetical protein